MPGDPQKKEELEELVRLGDEATRLLQSDVFEAAVSAPELTAIRKWARTKPEEKDVREDCYFDVRAYAKVRRGLTNLQSKGKRALIDLQGEE